MDDLPTTIFVPNFSNEEQEEDDDDHIFVDADDNDFLDVHLDEDVPMTTGYIVKEVVHGSPVSHDGSGSTLIEQHRRRTPVHLRQTTQQNDYDDDTDDDDNVEDERYFLPRVSPEAVPREITVELEVTPANPLEAMYREGLRKLAKSMKHSDLTRNAIKRQSKYSYRGSTTAAMRSKDFFLSSRCEEVESCRRQLLSMIHGA